MFKADEILRDEGIAEPMRPIYADLMLKRGILFALIGVLGHSMATQSQAELQRAIRVVGDPRGRN